MDPVPPVDKKRPYLEQFLEWAGNEDREKLFKTPTGGFKVKSMFLETTQDPLTRPFFTMKTRHHRNCWSFPLLYQEVGDITEYQVAMQLLYDWKQFVKMSTSGVMRAMIKQCREDLEVRIRSEALAYMLAITRDKTTQPSVKFGAARFLAKREWITDSKIRKTKLNEKGFVDKIEVDMEDDLKLLGEQFETSRFTERTN